MTQVNERENEMMRRQEIGGFAVKTYQNSAEFIYPGKSAFANEAPFVNFSIEQALTTSFGGLTITDIFWDVWDKLMVETDFAGIQGVESRISIEKCASNG